jgi:hypothetical protein
MDYQAKLADLASLSLDELVALESEIVAAFDQADQADDVDSMSAAADALDQVRAAISEAEGAEEDTEVVDNAEEEAQEPMAASAAPDTPDTPDTPVTAGAEPNQSVSTSATDQEAATVEIPEDRKPVPSSPLVTITAGADIPGISAGTPFTTADQVSRAMVHRIQSISRASGGDGEQHIVATVASAAAPERVLFGNDVEGNLAKIEAVTRPSAITAAGWCAPLESRYDIFGLGVASRPVRDALVGFQASRGGIRFTEAPTLGGFSNAMGVWDGSTAKPCLSVGCGNEKTALAEAITLCLEFGNMASRAYPELVSRNNELALVQFARFADDHLLALLKQQSTAITATKKWGTARDVLVAMGKAAAAFRYKHRLDRTFPIRAIAPQFLLDAMREDLTVGLPGDNMDVADSVIESYFGQRRINVSWHLDGHHGAAADPDAAGALAAVTAAPAYDLDGTPTAGLGNWDAFPGKVHISMFAEGTFLFLDGGTLDLGVVRDSTLIGTNSYKTFVETFEGVAKVGTDALWITADASILGAVTGTLDPASL